jgi:DNA-binding beta-propeller fold protein YncE
VRRRALTAAGLAAAVAVAAGCAGGDAAPRTTAAAPARGAGSPAPLTRPALSPRTPRRPAGRVFAVGPLPDAVAVDPATHVFAVAIHDPSRLALVDGRRGRLTRRVDVPVGGAGADGRPITPAVFLVPAEAGKRAVAVVPATRTAPGDVPQPTATVVFGRSFVSDPRTGHVDVLDGGRVVDHLAGLVRPAGIAAGDFDRALAVIDAGRRAVVLYDPRSLRRLASAPAGAGPTNVAAEGDLLFVADTAGDAVLTFTTRPRLRQIDRLALPGGAPYGVAVDLARRRLHVTLTATNTLVTVPTDGARTTPLRRPTVRQPDAVAVDSATGTIAVTGHAGGVLQLIRPTDATGPR